VFQPDEGMTPQEVQHEVLRLHRKFYAFHYLGRFGVVSLLGHLLHIGVTTVSMPFLWLLILPSKWPFGGPFAKQAKLAWQSPRRISRRARRHFEAYLIVQSVQKKLAQFNDKLTAVIHRRRGD
jgi:hypothetical protein